MEILIYIGGAVSVSGLAAIVWCMIAVLRAKKAQLSDEELREKIRKLIPVNAAALLLSVLGLMLVAVGVFLSR